MARLLTGGEDPLATVCRRAIAMASEDIGMADPQALQVAVAARDAFRMLGAPEGYLALAQMTIHLATAPKSNRTCAALNAAMEAARATPAAPVPLPIRNAPTALMRDLGYSAGYRYAHDAPEGYAPQRYLPDVLRDASFYEPGPHGAEAEVAARMARWRSLDDGDGPPQADSGGESRSPPPGAVGRRRGSAGAASILRRSRPTNTRRYCASSAWAGPHTALSTCWCVTTRPAWRAST